MKSRTVRVAAEDDVAVISAAVRLVGGDIAWHDDCAFGRRYGSIAGDVADAAIARNASRAVVFDTTIIAVAITPSTPEALPLLIRALSGAGKPDGVVTCERVGDAVVIEWDPQRTPVAVVLALADLELERLRASRVIRVLTFVSAERMAQIAGTGLHAPGIAASSILDVRLHECGIDV